MTEAERLTKMHEEYEKLAEKDQFGNMLPGVSYAKIKQDLTDVRRKLEKVNMPSLKMS